MNNSIDDGLTAETRTLYDSRGLVGNDFERPDSSTNTFCFFKTNEFAKNNSNKKFITYKKYQLNKPLHFQLNHLQQ